MKDLEKEVVTLKASSDIVAIEKMKKQNAELHRNITMVTSRAKNAENSIADLQKALKVANRIKEKALKVKQIASDELQ